MSWADESAEEKTVYPDAPAWLAAWLAPRWCRSWESGHRCWCPAWQEHPEAVSRLTGLWLVWESIAAAPKPTDPSTGLATWWLSFADPMMAALLDADGPFKRCGKGHTDLLGPLPLEAPAPRA